MDTGEESRRDNLRPRRKERTEVSSLSEMIAVRGDHLHPQTGAPRTRRHSKDTGPRAFTSEYEWAPRGFVDPLPAELISRRRPRKRYYCRGSKYFERSKTSRRIIILERKTDPAPVSACLRNIVKHFKSLFCETPREKSPV